MNNDGAFRKKRVYFSQVSNEALRDKNLSMKAKGLYALIQSYITIEGFTLYKNTLKRDCQEGGKAFEAAWKELKDKGYLVQYKLRNNKGSFYYEYDLLDTNHNPKKEGMDLVDVEKGDTGKGGMYNNTDSNNTDLNNTNERIDNIREGANPKGVNTMSVSSIPFYDYVNHLLKSYVDIERGYKQEIYNSILYYCSKYEEVFGVEHIRYKTATLKTVIKRLYNLYTVGIWDEQNGIMVGDDLSLEDFKIMVNKFFTVKFNGKGGKKISYTLLSFLNDNVLVHRFYEELY